jgi:hypothetical protein
MVWYYIRPFSSVGTVGHLFVDLGKDAMILLECNVRIDIDQRLTHGPGRESTPRLRP